jgi:predicted  nucleic acid-binding Zn-ribbon protein
MNQTLDANEFSAFLGKQRMQITSAFNTIEKMQHEYQGAYTRFKADHDKTLRALTERIETQAGGTGQALKPLIEVRLPQEQQSIAQQIAGLAKQADELQARMDELPALSQQAIAGLREANPKLNEREEALKTDIANQQQALDDLNTQILKAGKVLGFVLHAAKIHALDRERFRIIGRLQQLEEDLKDVRQGWENLSTNTAQKETEWRTEWRQRTEQLSQVRQQRDYLEQNRAAETWHRATGYVIDNLKTLPAEGDESLLLPMIDLNIQTDDFQTALGSVASILGILKGMDEGLKRLDQSVQTLITEQKRHSEFLPNLSIVLDDQVAVFGQTWDDLAAKCKDEQTLADHPADFVAAMQPFLEQRLTQEHIAAYFNALGKALNDATAGWGGA